MLCSLESITDIDCLGSKLVDKIVSSLGQDMFVVLYQAPRTPTVL